MSKKWYVISGLGSRRLQLNRIRIHHYIHTQNNLPCPALPGDIRFRRELSIKRAAYILDLHWVAWIWTCAASTAHWVLPTTYCSHWSHCFPSRSESRLTFKCQRVSHLRGKLGVSFHSQCLQLAGLKLNFKPYQSIGRPLHDPTQPPPHLASLW